MSALMLTRSEAVTRSIGMTLCVSDDGATCNTSLKDYSKGWIIFSDCNQDGEIESATTNCDIDGNGTNDPDRVLKVQGSYKNLSIVASSNASKDRFTYTESGRPGNGLTSFNIGTETDAPSRQISIALTGRAKSKDLED